MKSWKSVAAIITNKFIVAATDGNMRLVFGEQFLKDDETEYHQAVTMRKSDARELANIINRILDEHEAKEKKDAVSAGQ